MGWSNGFADGTALALSINERFSIRGIDKASLLVTLIAAKSGGSIELIGV
ncbi:MAG: hypothetical protein ACREHD_26315 [Pirellulales bacterium]